MGDLLATCLLSLVNHGIIGIPVDLAIHVAGLISDIGSLGVDDWLLDHRVPLSHVLHLLGVVFMFQATDELANVPEVVWVVGVVEEVQLGAVTIDQTLAKLAQGNLSTVTGAIAL